MKRKITSLLAALLLMSGLTWAQTTDVLNHTVIGVPSTNYETWSDLTLTSGAVYAGNTAGGNEAIQMRSNNNNSGIVTTTSAGMVTNITVTWNSNTNSSRILNVYGSNTAYNAATDLYGDNAGTLIGTIPNGTAELEITEGYAFIGIRSANGALWLDEIQITWEEGGTPAPSISIENNNELAYDATSGSFNFTVNNPVSGGSMAASTEEEWISNPTVAASAVNFTTTVNQDGAPREGVITLTYTYGEQTITKPVTITQAGNPNTIDNISDITAAGTYSVQGTIVAKNTRGFIVGDGTGYVYYYNASYSQADYNIGDMVKLAGSVVTYGGVFEFNNSTTITAATSSNYVAGDPTALTGEQMDARVASYTPAELSSYVQYEGILTVSDNYYNITNIAGATTAKGSISNPLNGEEIAALNGKQVVVTGYYVGVSSNQYYNTMIGSVEEIVTTEPSIMVANATVNVSAEGAEGTITVLYNNFDDIVANVYFCDGEGAAATYNWIYAEIDDDNNIYYNVDANDGAARTAYLEVNDGEFYSNLVTINQAAYVAPSIAVLPFIWEGGSSEAFAALDGVTISGNGSDYAASNAPYLIKFDGTGDYIQVHTDSQPDIVTIGVKMVGGGNTSTITVQGSTDGETFDEGEELTISGSQNDILVLTSTRAFDEGVRYVRLYFTKGSNVGVGPITITKPSIDPVVAVSPATINASAEGENGILTVTYQNITEINASIYFCDAEGAAATYDWITASIDAENNVAYIINANEGAARTGYFKVMAGETPSNLVTINQAAYEALSIAVLPFIWEGGSSEAFAALDGVTISGNGSDYATSNAPYLIKFDGTGDYIQVHTDSQPGIVTIGVKMLGGGNTSTITVQGSTDGETFDEGEALTISGSQNDTLVLTSTRTFDESVRYVRLYFTKGSNVGVGPITIAKPSIDPVVAVSPATINASAEGKNGILTVTYQNITDITANVYFCDADGESTTYDWITAEVNDDNNVEYTINANNGEARMAYLKVYVGQTYSNLVTFNQAAYVAPFEPVNYTLATTIESGKTYIIVGSKTVEEETHYYAMGEQRENNRAGIAISVDGTTATVETADVHEVVITALEEEGFYSIYDGGYLYAAGSNKNWLRTQDSLDVNAQWSISIDTVSHIVADSSANRNVMQFNYNGGNPIFSCYGSASQSPVYLYVKEEATTIVTQTIALAAGTNWVSFYMDITLNDLKNALVAAAPNSSIKIKSKTQTHTYNPNTHRWSGSLSWDVALKYNIEIATDCEITLQGDPIDPATHHITIKNGNNWIGFPFSESMTLANAFASFAQNGDKVKSKGGTATYNRGRWTGSVSALEPGKGYIYNSAVTEDRDFAYPTPASKGGVNPATTGNGPAVQKSKRHVTNLVMPASRKNALDINRFGNRFIKK